MNYEDLWRYYMGRYPHYFDRYSVRTLEEDIAFSYRRGEGFVYELETRIEQDILKHCDLKQPRPGEEPQDADLNKVMQVVENVVEQLNEETNQDRDEYLQEHHGEDENGINLTVQEKNEMDERYPEYTFNRPHFSSSQKNQRKKLHDRAKGIFAKQTAQNIVKELLVSKLYPDYTKLSRHSQTALLDMAVDYGDLVQLCDYLKHPQEIDYISSDGVKHTKGERFSSRLNIFIREGIGFLNNNMAEKTDEEMLESIRKNFNLMHFMGEWQEIDTIMDEFHMTLSQYNREHLTKAMINPAVDQMTLKDLLGMFAGPYYVDLDIATMHTIHNVLDLKAVKPRLGKGKKYVSMITEGDDMADGFPSPLHQYAQKAQLLSLGDERLIDDRIANVGRLSDSVTCLLDGFHQNLNSVRFIVDGKEVTVDAFAKDSRLAYKGLTPAKLAMELALRGKKVGVVTNGQPSQFIMAFTCKPDSLGLVKVAPVVVPEQMYSNDIEHNNNQLHAYIDNLLYFLKNNNRWYISSKEKYGVVMTTLRRALELDPADREAVKRLLITAREQARDYLQDRFKNKTTDSPLSEKRYAAMEGVLRSLTNIEDMMKKIERMENREAEKGDPIELDLPNENLQGGVRQELYGIVQQVENVKEEEEIAPGMSERD